MPETPKTSFLRGVSTLFSGNQKEAGDVESILAEKPPTATASMKSVAHTLPCGTSNNMDAAQRHGISAGQAATMALQNLNERSDKLNATVDATERLHNSASGLQSRSANLAAKYAAKKWYQL